MREAVQMKQFLDERAGSAPAPNTRGTEEFNTWKEEFRTELLNRWGLSLHLGARRPPPHVIVTGVTDADTYRIERIHFESRPGLLVTGNLYIPRGLSGMAPAIVYLCGHHTGQKMHYQQHARRFVQLGFITLILDTLLHGEVPGHHRGTHGEGAFHWISRGYSPAAVETLNAIRGVDVLKSRPDVDPEAIGITGHSGGGAIAWWAAALDPRIAALASSTGTGSWGHHIRYRTLDTHCDCYFPPLLPGECVEDVYALLAPRPALIVAPGWDHVYHPDAVRASYEALLPIYRRQGAPEKLSLFAFDAPHQYTPESRREIFRWMVHHLAGREEGGIDDVDAHLHTHEELSVFQPGDRVPDNGNTRVQDWFLTGLPAHGDLDDHLQRVCAPAGSPRPSSGRWEVTREYVRRDLAIRDLRIDNGDGWGLDACEVRPAATSPTAFDLILRGPEEHGPLWQTPLPTSPLVARLICHVRGTGDTAWHPSQNWHLRRAAALLGTSIAAMRAWDVACFISVARELMPDARITVHAKGDLSVSALIGAILDGGRPALRLYDPPRSLDCPSSPDGYDSVVEIPSILRWVDMPDLLARTGAEVLKAPPSTTQ